MSEQAAVAEETAADAPATVVDPPGDDVAADGAPETPDKDPETPKMFTQDELDAIVQKRLGRQRKQYDDRIDAILAERKPTAAEPEPEKPVEVPLTREKPRIEDHDFDQEAYLDALTDWKLEQAEARKTAEAKENKAKEENEAKEKTERETLEDFENRRLTMIEAGTEKYPDFEKVAFSIPVDEITGAIVLHSDNPADIAYHLGQNPKEFERISKLVPVQRAFEIGKIQAVINATQGKTTNAPPPPSGTVKGKTRATTDYAKLARDNPQEYMRLRNEGKIR